MKNLISVFVALSSALITYTTPAFGSTMPTTDEYAFVFRPTGEIRLPQTNTKAPHFEFRVKAASYEEAFKVAAKACYSHFRAGQSSFTEDDGLSIIDLCANPRGS